MVYQLRRHCKRRILRLRKKLQNTRKFARCAWRFNLMLRKFETETQILRLISSLYRLHSTLCVFLRMNQKRPSGYILFNFDDFKDKNYDDLIVTGALVRILNTRMLITGMNSVALLTGLRSMSFLPCTCAGALAGLYYLHDIPRSVGC